MMNFDAFKYRYFSMFFFLIQIEYCINVILDLRFFLNSFLIHYILSFIYQI